MDSEYWKRFWRRRLSRRRLLQTTALGAAGLAVAGVVGCGDDEEEVPAAVRTIRLGATLSDTGTYAREGAMTKRGYEMAIELLNEAKIVVGDEVLKFELILYDDESEKDRATTLYEKLITEDQVDFLLGPYSSTLTLPVSAITEKYGVIMVEANGASESIFEADPQYLFATLTTATFHPRAAMERLSELGAKTLVALVEDTPYPLSVGDGIKKWAPEFGLEILGFDTYPQDADSVATELTRFKGQNPDIFIGGGYYDDALIFLRESKEIDFNPKAFVIAVGPSSVKFIEEVGIDSQYVWAPVQWHQTMDWQRKNSHGLGWSTPMEFFDAHVRHYGTEPDFQEAESATAPLVLAIAMINANSVDAEAVRAALRALDIETFYGPIAFDEVGRNSKKPMAAVQIQEIDGQLKHVVVAPQAAATHEPIYPFPGWGV